MVVEWSKYPEKKKEDIRPLLFGTGRCEACGVEGRIAYYHDVMSWLDNECRDKGLTRVRMIRVPREIQE